MLIEAGDKLDRIIYHTPMIDNSCRCDHNLPLIVSIIDPKENPRTLYQAYNYGVLEDLKKIQARRGTKEFRDCLRELIKVE